MRRVPSACTTSNPGHRFAAAFRTSSPLRLLPLWRDVAILRRCRQGNEAFSFDFPASHTHGGWEQILVDGALEDMGLALFRHFQDSRLATPPGQRAQLPRRCKLVARGGFEDR